MSEVSFSTEQEGDCGVLVIKANGRTFRLSGPDLGDFLEMLESRSVLAVE